MPYCLFKKNVCKLIDLSFEELFDTSKMRYILLCGFFFFGGGGDHGRGSYPLLNFQMGTRPEKALSGPWVAPKNFN